MTTQEALTKATEVGYHMRSTDATAKESRSSSRVGVQAMVLDPIFWFALGWALGWHEQQGGGYDQWWREPWHRCVDCVAEGKTPDDFFETLA
jgi:hypothetical protein